MNDESLTMYAVNSVVDPDPDSYSDYGSGFPHVKILYYKIDAIHVRLKDKKFPILNSTD